MRPTIKDIARILEVSPATVSYAINGGRISERTRERVMAVVRELDYHPNENARHLHSKKARTFGIVFRNVSHLRMDNPFVTAVMAGVTDAARQREYDVLLLRASSDEIRVEASLRSIFSGRVDGLLFIAPYPGSPILSSLADRSLPFTIVSSFSDSPKANSVVVDGARGADLAMDYLWSLGHRHIGFADGRSCPTELCPRYEAYFRRMGESGVTGFESWMFNGAFEYQPAYDRALEVLSTRRRPTAVFAANDLMAFGVMDAAAALGVRVPAELSVVGFDDIPAAEWHRPALTTVRQPMYEMGMEAVSLLVEQLERGSSPRQLVFEPQLVVRSSCAPPRRTRRIE